MSQIRKVVFDTSTLVGAALLPGSTPHRAPGQAIRSCDLFATIDTLAELDQVLARTKFDRYLALHKRREFAASFRESVRVFGFASDLAQTLPPSRDLNDNKFLSPAQAVEADAIVSSDEDLLVLHPWNGIAILTASEFLARFPDSPAE